MNYSKQQQNKLEIKVFSLFRARVWVYDRYEIASI